MWTGPVDITVDELFIVLSPNIETFQSNNESFIEFDAVNQSIEYDPSNMFNIFEN